MRKYRVIWVYTENPARSFLSFSEHDTRKEAEAYIESSSRDGCMDGWVGVVSYDMWRAES